MQETVATSSERVRAGLGDYVAMARPTHWVKHLFILPGIALALPLRSGATEGLPQSIALGFLCAMLVASANYVLNEWLDATSDAFHPSKAARPAVAKRVSPVWVAIEYLLLAGIGLWLATAVSRLFAFTALVFLLSGVIYNVRPLRLKDRAYLDVLTEAINNPLRLTLGWAMVDGGSLPPSSLLAAFWMGGAFLMALKRFAEFRAVTAAGAGDRLGLYRASFRRYDEPKLLLSAVLYALMAAFFLAVFLVKYRIEYLLALPLFAAVFISYLRIALKPDSRVQEPEKLFRERSLLLLLSLLVAALGLLTWLDLPILERLTDPHFIELHLE